MKRKRLRSKPKSKDAVRKWLDELAAMVAEEQARLQPMFPYIDPHDLGLILANMAKPLEDRRYFVRKIGRSYVR
jgi:hypothetical protein